MIFARRAARPDTGTREGDPGRAADVAEPAVSVADATGTAVAGLDPETAAIAVKIRSLVGAGLISLPPMPQVAARLTRILSDEETADVNVAGELIENDPALAAAVLRLANSAVFGGLSELTDPAQAVGRLGLRQVSTLVTAISHRGNFTCKDPVRLEILHALWDHSMVTALLSRRFAQERGADASEAFLAGLLHDTGKLLVLRGADHFATHEKRTVEPDRIDLLMSTLHCDMGHGALVRWRIAESVCEVARRHHEPQLPVDATLILQVQLADEVARKIGAHLRPDPDLDLAAIPAVATLGTSAEEIEALLPEVQDEFERVRQMFL